MTTAPRSPGRGAVVVFSTPLPLARLPRSANGSKERTMRLYPPVEKDEALAWLRSEATTRWGGVTPEQEQSLADLAEAMAAVSAVKLPEGVEPELL